MHVLRLFVIGDLVAALDVLPARPRARVSSCSPKDFQRTLSLLIRPAADAQIVRFRAGRPFTGILPRGLSVPNRLLSP
jgi:hypothetical protein